MSPIKFRAWNFTEKKMFYNAYLYPWNMVVDNDDKLIGYSWIDVYLMQSTWLEDKNGDEIFRGDIVIFEYYWPTYIWEVSSNEFFHSCIKVWEKEFHIDNAMIWEVIGNIYENPELLNV